MDKRKLFTIFSVVLVEMLSFSIVLPLLPYLAVDLGASASQIGLLAATYPIAQLIGAPLLGKLSDRYGRKPILLASIVGTGAAFVVLATAHSLPILFVSRFIDGITGGNINVAQAYISDVTTEKNRGRALGMIGAAFGLGFILGPATGGVLASINYSLPAWLGAGLEVMNIVLVSVLLKESLTTADRARLALKPRKFIDFQGLRNSLTHHRVGPLLTIRTFSSLSFGIFESGFALWGIAALALTVGQNGLVLAWVGVLSVIMQAFFIGKLTDRFSDDNLILAALAIAAVSLGIWGFIPNLWLLVLLMPAISVGLAVTNTVTTSALTKSVARDEVGGILGVQTSILSFTRIPAPIIAGVLIERSAVWTPGVLAGLLVGSMVPYAWRKLCVTPGKAACELEELPAEE